MDVFALGKNVFWASDLLCLSLDELWVKAGLGHTDRRQIASSKRRTYAPVSSLNIPLPDHSKRIKCLRLFHDSIAATSCIFRRARHIGRTFDQLLLYNKLFVFVVLLLEGLHVVIDR